MIEQQHMTPVLIIEDEIEIRRSLKLTLTTNGYKISEAKNGRDGVRMLTAERPELIILDLGLPDMDGLEVIKQIRVYSEVPIIVLSARGHEHDKVGALELGADDYLTKPFSAAELLARVKVGLKHARTVGSNTGDVYEYDGLKVDLTRRLVTQASHDVRLTPIEYKFLSILVKNVGRVVTHTQLLKEIWVKNTPDTNNYLRIHTQHLREKLGDDPLNPRYIITEPGVGYRLKTT